MIRVVSWNVLADAYLKDEYFPHTPPEVLERGPRRKAVADRIEQIQATKVDVLCLQEVDVALFGALEERLKDEATGRHYKKRGKGEGLAIFVRHALTTEPEWKEHAFSDMSGFVALGVTVADLTVVTTHLKWEPDGTLPEAHRGRAQLAELLDTWPSGVRIVCGDFNAAPTSDVLALAKERGLSDAYASLDDACTCNANGKRKRIDYVLHTAELRATPSPLPPIADDTPLPSATEPSDHLPIEVRLDRT
ncbi:MAG: endonuclease/exonuclease/phosphatase family protein [Labilithrix sp.]|nr:endonuclease/exonuclease/phosphatase family protein [Labilithrix sp.]MCW5816159.1 endonuclease/exonuclease/phosphatase family protein [Labilithrix sp.]